MVYVLKFNFHHEFRYSWGDSINVLYNLFENLNESMIFYRYALYKDIKRAFGVKNPDKIDFNKITGENLIIFHLSIFKDNVKKFRELINWCQEKDINVIFVIPKIRNSTYIDQIEDMLEDWNCQFYELDNFKNIKPILRDIKLRKLV